MQAAIPRRTFLKTAFVAAALLLCAWGNAFSYPDEAKFSFSVTNGAGMAALTPNGRYLGLLSPTGSVVTIVDTSIFSAVVTFSLGALPTSIEAAEDSAAFFVTTASEDEVWQIDLLGAPEDFVAATFENIAAGSDYLFGSLVNSLIFLLGNSGDTVFAADPTTGDLISGTSSTNTRFSATKIQGFSKISRLFVLANSGETELINTDNLTNVGSVC